MAGFDYIALAFQSVFITVALALAIAGIDDAILDISFHLRRAWRRLHIYRRHPRLAAEELSVAAEQRIAILIPAWREAGVIEPMLTNLRQTLLYNRYTVFVGHYPNDRQTADEITSLVQTAGDWLVAVEMPHDGPTSKADCLNRLYGALSALEADKGISFDVVVLHDAEDVVHPLEATVFNHLFPAKAMVQLPVIPLERPLIDLLGGHYLDEFAEMHGKDLVLREAFVKAIPSAGVGCAFRRDVLGDLCADFDGPFRQTSLTEDYDLALRLGQRGEPAAFVQIPARKTNMTHRDLVATREYFPNRISAAVRQKARWFIGIAFQAWHDHSWHGSWRQKYALFRDRKAIWASLLVLLGYALALIWLAWWLASRQSWYWGADPSAPAAIFEPLILQVLLGVNLGFLINRIVHRIWTVSTLYGPVQGAFSVLRLPVGNLVNALAALRAIRLYLVHRRSGRPLAWQKTSHAFPTVNSLRPFRARLGQILVHQGLAKRHDVDAALAAQRQNARPLGEILLARGRINQADLARALSLQAAPSQQNDPALQSDPVPQSAKESGNAD